MHQKITSKKFLAIGLVFMILFFIHCSDESTVTNNDPLPELSSIERQLMESDNTFGFNLFRSIVQDQQDTNIFISPLSVAMALGMTYNGAAGDTRDAMQNTLELAGLTAQEINESYQHVIQLLTGLDPEVQFQIANSIWYRQDFPVEDEFIDLNQTYFNAEVSELDFFDDASVDIINNWVSENTNGKIESIITAPINPATVMFLINAIYFLANWTYQFDEELTQDGLFTKPDGSQITCQMMEIAADLPYFENELFQAVELPYGNGDFSMTIFLPKPEISIDYLISEFNPENWSLWLNSFQIDTTRIYLPKFTLEYEIALNDILIAMGMGIAFSPGLADFSNISTFADLFISKVKHKTFLKVDEEGTEAAAVTIVEIGITSLPQTSTIYIDRPFVFAIRENHSQSILFLGKIVEPVWDE